MNPSLELAVAVLATDTFARGTRKPDGNMLRDFVRRTVIRSGLPLFAGRPGMFSGITESR